MSTATLGTDIATPINDEGVVDLDPSMSLATGRLQLAQAIARRVTTQPGAMSWAEGTAGDGYGIDVRAFLGSDADATTASHVAALVQTEVMKDERVLAADASASILDGLLTLSIRLADASGPFRMVLAVSGVTIELLRVSNS